MRAGHIGRKSSCLFLVHQLLRDRKGGARCLVPGAFPGSTTPLCRYRQRHSRRFCGFRLLAFGAPHFTSHPSSRQQALFRGKLRGLLGVRPFLSPNLAVPGLLHLGRHFWSACPDPGVDTGELLADHAGSEASFRNGWWRCDSRVGFCRLCLKVGSTCVWHGESSTVDGSASGDFLRVDPRSVQDRKIPAHGVTGTSGGDVGDRGEGRSG
jgi:hypothetical protein